MKKYVNVYYRYVWFGCLWTVFDMFGLVRVGVSDLGPKNTKKHLDPWLYLTSTHPVYLIHIYIISINLSYFNQSINHMSYSKNNCSLSLSLTVLNDIYNFEQLQQ